MTEKRTDYAANRGPLDRREYAPRRPDPFSCLAGCLALSVLWAMLIVAAALAIDALT